VATKKKSFFETVHGWAFVQDDDGDSGGDDSSADVEQEEVAQAVTVPRRKTPPPPPPPTAPASIRLPGNIPNMSAGSKPTAGTFAEVFRAAHISDQEQERVAKATALLQSLPPNASHEVKKPIVEASLIAFGIPIDEIIEGCAQEIQALEAYIQQGERHTQEVLNDAKRRIEKLTGEINEIRKLMELQVQTQQELIASSNQEKLKVQQVLEFFGQEAVARVVQASPKLVDPKGD
jgi:hypothetical protein